MKKWIKKHSSSKLMILFLSVGFVFIFLIIAGSSYAYFVTTVKGKEMVIYTGTLAVNYAKKTDVINNLTAYPMSDTEGLATTAHEFTVTNNGNIDARYRVRLETDSTVTNMIDLRYVKISYQVDGNEYSTPMLLSDLGSSLVFIKNNVLTPSSSNTIGIKLWIDLNAGNDIQNKEFKARIVVDSIQNVDDGYVADTIPIIYLNKDSNGNQDIHLTVGDTYNELGVEKIEDDKDIFTTDQATISYEYYDGSNLNVVSSVDTSKTGIYYVNYSVTDSANNTCKVTRVVTVNNSSIIPSISLVGDSSISLVVGGYYNEIGATIADNNRLIIVGEVNTKAVGIYTIRYIVVDSNGNVNSVVRTVTINSKYKEGILNGTDPVLADNLVPVVISDNGIVTKADTTTEWYSYENKKWANAVILKKSYDENTIYDLSGNGYNAKLMNGLSLIKEKDGNVALNFDGVDDYAELPTLPESINWQDGITIEFEANWEQFNTFSRIFDFGNAKADTISVYNFSNSNGLTFNYLNSVTSEQNRVIKDELIVENEVAKYRMNITKTSDGYTTNFYKNSELVLSNFSTTGYMKNIDRTTNFLGKSNYDSDKFFKGKIYNLKITQADGTVVLWYDFSINENEVIEENQIESYFVWIPKYSYQLFDLGNYSSLTSISNKTQEIKIKFGTSNTSDNVSGECTTPFENGQGVAGSSGNCKVGDYMTHPAFLAFDTTGLWVGKFETGYDGATSTTEAQINSIDTSKIIIKPNVYSWRNITVGNAFKNSYDYQRDLDSHMMKNTEWGAVSYLQHSAYGSQASVRINNNGALITGYAGTEEPTLGYAGGVSTVGNRVESTVLGIDATYSINYLNSKSVAASTTNNYSGIYDMSGGAWEYVAGYTTGAATVGGASAITSLYPNFFSDSTYLKYWDKYTSTESTNYNNRILGDATGEMGPFGSEKDPDGGTRNKSSWYKGYGFFADSSHFWFARGGRWDNGNISDAFAFGSDSGGAYTYSSFRIVLAP